MRKLKLVLIACICYVSANAQQLPLFSQFMLNDYGMNPAVAGIRDYFEVKSINRYQWIGITDAPRTYMLSLNGALVPDKMGVGGYLFTDIVGPTRRIGFYGSYSYHLKIMDDINLGAGISAGLLQFQVDGSKIQMNDPSDLVLSTGMQSVLVPDFGFGIYAYPDAKNYYVGISVPQVMENKLNFFENEVVTLSQLKFHTYITGGYKFENVIEDITIEPATVIKFVVPAPPQIDIGARAIYQEKASLGLFYRSYDAIAVMLGYDYKGMSIGYAYDFTTSNIRRYSSGTHEILLAVRFGQGEE